MYVFILLIGIYTSNSFILPAKMHRTQCSIKLYNKEKNENIINLLKKESDIESDYEREYEFNKKLIELEDSFNKNTNNFFKLDSNYKSNYTNLLHNHVIAVRTMNDNIINTINSINVSSINENIRLIKKMMSNKKHSVSQMDFPIGVSNFNSKSWFAPLRYMLFKNQILDSLTPTEHSDDCNCKKCHSDECHKEGCSECCHCEDCIIEYDVDGIIINKEKDIPSKECSKSDYDDITDNNFIDTIGLVPVGIIPNFFLRFLLKKLLIPF